MSQALHVEQEGSVGRVLPRVARVGPLEVAVELVGAIDHFARQRLRHCVDGRAELLDRTAVSEIRRRPPTQRRRAPGSRPPSRIRWRGAAGALERSRGLRRQRCRAARVYGRNVGVLRAEYGLESKLAKAKGRRFVPGVPFLLFEGPQTLDAGPASLIRHSMG